MNTTYYRNALAVMADKYAKGSPYIFVRLPDGTKKSFAELTVEDIAVIEEAAR